MDIEKLLKLVAIKKASDLFITAGFPPSIKLDGHLIPVTKIPLTATEAKELVLGVMDEKQRLEFELKQECNFAIAKVGTGRFERDCCPAADSLLDGAGRRPAIEVLLNTPLAQDMIRKGDVYALKELMKKSRELGMQTFDQAFF